MQEACRLCMYARVRFTHRGCAIGWMRLRPRVATHTRPCPRQGSLLTDRVVADGLCALLFELGTGQLCFYAAAFFCFTCGLSAKAGGFGLGSLELGGDAAGFFEFALLFGLTLLLFGHSAAFGFFFGCLFFYGFSSFSIFLVLLPFFEK